MASRRAVLSATRLLPTATARLANPCFATTARHAIQQKATLGIANSIPRGVRYYSQKDDDSVVPGSKIWEFEDMTAQLQKPDENIVFIDVREPPELQQTGKIPGALNIPITSAVQSYHISPEDFEEMHGFERPSKDKTLVFYCKAGIRAKSAAGLAKHAGWNSVGEYTGSWLDWEAKHGPKQKV